ncbi:MAG TPA: RDD family protein [Thermoanaerobaculia bacterium]|nr:RDD family protein [Thermoanaerobaculia bacterium]
MLDTYRTVETPEGVELGLRMAGPPVRLLAYGTDVAIRTVLLWALAIPLATLGEVGLGLLLILFFLGEWFYPVFFEVLVKGATPGKRLMGIAVLSVDGTPVSWTASVMRNLLRFADFLPVGYGFGLITMFLTRDFRRLGDLVAGTVVVYTREEQGPRNLPAAAPAPPPVALGREEQRAVVEFAQRLPSWSSERADELASLAAPLVGARGDLAVVRLVALANWLVGRRE